MGVCVDCGGSSHTCYGSYGGKFLCRSCYDKREVARLDEKAANVSRPSDFRDWSGADLSDLFWNNLGRYVKEPSEHGYNILLRAYQWACHDNHGLASSFSHALHWANIDLHSEWARWSKK